MIISDIKVSGGDVTCRLSADFHFDTHWVWGDAPFSFWMEFPAACLSWLNQENADPFLAIGLAPAMVLGEPLTIEGKISSEMWRAIPRIQAVYRCFDRALFEVDVAVEQRGEGVLPPGAGEDGGLQGLFFSMGVDSSYCLWKDGRPGRRDKGQFDELLVVEGFDVYLWERERYPPMLEGIQEVGRSFDKEVLSVTTNLRDFSDRVADWVRLYHGPALASIPLSLGGRFASVDIAAGQTYDFLVGRGAHPLLDPLWSTEALTFRHNGLEANRLQKIQAISETDVLLDHLRVCATSEVTSEYNCGRCEKCLRTMIALHVAGALTRCGSLPQTIDLERVRRFTVDNLTAARTLEELMRLLDDDGTDGEIKAALKESLNRVDVARLR